MSNANIWFWANSFSESYIICYRYFYSPLASAGVMAGKRR